eukprot:2629365-Amphidinium_carterae.2
MACCLSSTDEVGLRAVVQAIAVQVLWFKVEVAHDQPGGGLHFDPSGKSLHQGDLLWLCGPCLSVDLHERELALAYVEACCDAATGKCVLSCFCWRGADVFLDVDANPPTCCELVAACALAWRRADGPFLRFGLSPWRRQAPIHKVYVRPP